MKYCSSLFLILLLALAVTYSSCYYDKEDELYGVACNPTTQRGPLFNQMRTLISTRCNGSGCHMNGDMAGGHNFDADCSIVDNYLHIQEECMSDGMPIAPQALLSQSEKDIINNWVNAGHGLSN